MAVHRKFVSWRTVSNEELLDALEKVEKMRKPTRTPKPLTELSRVNEQEIFAAFTYLKLKEEKPAVASKFLMKFAELYKEVGKKDSLYGIFEATRLAFEELRRSKNISLDKFREIRLYALGKSQLDSVRDETTVKKITDRPSDTAVRAVKTALKKVDQNTIATEEELANFRKKNKERRESDLSLN
jgi:hypothetical protein